MSIQTIGIVSTGDMGHQVGRTLREGGFRIVTALDERSERSRNLAEKAGIENVGNLATLISHADLLLSVMPPAEAVGFASVVAAQMAATGNRPLFADCNAIAPATSRKVATMITEAGAHYLDAAVIGMPPGRKNPPRLYVSGERPERLQVLARPDMIVRTLDGGVGAASAIKMCYAALNKGGMTLEALAIIGAAQLGLSVELRRELADAQPQMLARIEERLPWLAADAKRWSGEMLEIAKTFSDVGLTPLMHEGAAEIFQLLADSPLAAETRETADRSRSIEDAVAAFAASLSARGRDEAD
ncbi:MAG TPA: 6-phosphogluconate dehydrogenase [Rhodospirillaceae bacterium]|nr:6-phosphogluconate dehydrogenase [Rhodospirillaceae bacterium]